MLSHLLQPVAGTSYKLFIPLKLRTQGLSQATKLPKPRMADDGLLLNFSIGDALLATKPRFKGGKWKDRLTAKKVSQHRQQKIFAPKPAIVNGTASHDLPPTAHGDEESRALDAVRPVKRLKVDQGPNPAPSRPGTAATGRKARGRPSGPGRGKPAEVVSSLFSYNPASKAPTGQEEATADLPPAEASNAPLLDGVDTFTSLGLSPSIATHLLTKLGLEAPTAIQKAVVPQLLREDADAFIQAETGSGKTLAYLLPIVQRIVALSEQGAGDGAGGLTRVDGGGAVHRDSGLFAIILAPTRELCKQISVVLEGLLRCAHWIVAGTVIGGEKKKSEKARIRKGLNILVATPGRLADHLNNTKVLDVRNVRWLVLDEGDRLMELGFEEEIQGIVSKLEQRSQVTTMQGLPVKRTTVLCSATMKMNVQRLGEISLKDAVHIKADPLDAKAFVNGREPQDAAFSAPAQLKQSYAVVPAKQRLVTLTAVLKRAFARRGSVMKAIVFLSCADSVDFHFEIFTRKEASPVDGEGVPAPPEEIKGPHTSSTAGFASALSTTDSHVRVCRLHGSLLQITRTATLAAFTKSKDPSVLICTDVASRGLDLPNIDFVIEYDPPFSADDHLHRIGRTARAGRDGRAMIFLMPGPEEGYVDILKQGYREGQAKGLVRNEAEDLLRKGFGKVRHDWEDKATEWQLEVERWVLEVPQHLEMARRAFQSCVRAYATHVAAERAIFDMKSLHLGHLAKAFALRDKPGSINVPGLRQSKERTAKEHKAQRRGTASDGGERRKASRNDHDVPMTDGQEAARRMRMKMKEHMAGANEFNIG